MASAFRERLDKLRKGEVIDDYGFERSKISIESTLRKEISDLKQDVEYLQSIITELKSKKAVKVQKEGVEYEVTSISAFVVEHGLDKGNFSRLLSGKALSVKGFTVV
jgi:adenylate cyclase class IV